MYRANSASIIDLGVLKIIALDRIIVGRCIFDLMRI